MAQTAYTSVVGAPESFEGLEATTALAGGGAAEVSTEFGHVDSASRQALWRQLASVIGMDVMHMRLSLPIWLFEPTTALTRMAETFEFADLLDRAADTDDPVLRDCLVAAFVVSAFSHTERVRKPFNPVLGETYELKNPVNDMRFYAEQVSHHPPISVSRADGRGWAAGEVVDINATYLGNSVEIQNVGSRYVHLESNDRYSWNLPKAVVSNLFMGGAFVDHHGTITLTNETTGSIITLVLTKCGWFSAGRWEVTGELVDASNEKLVTFKGSWNKYLDCERVGKSKGEGANRLWMAGAHALPEEEGGGDTGPLAKCTKFTKKVLAMDPEHMAVLPPTDSRFRTDRIALFNGDTRKAAEEKIRVEQIQRQRRQAAKAAGTKHVPRWFSKIEEEGQVWGPTGDYWAESAKLGPEERKDATLW